ncbi:MAG: hypothetical protein ACRDPH_03815 [Marmoricola sp.]
MTSLHDPTVALIAFICMTVLVFIVLGGGVLMSTRARYKSQQNDQH